LPGCPLEKRKNKFGFRFSIPEFPELPEVLEFPELPEVLEFPELPEVPEFPEFPARGRHSMYKPSNTCVNGVISRVVLSDVLGGKNVVEERDGRTVGFVY
jgi:hypothetical protein